MALRRFEALEECCNTLQGKDLPLTEVSAALNLLEGERVQIGPKVNHYKKKFIHLLPL